MYSGGNRSDFSVGKLRYLVICDLGASNYKVLLQWMLGFLYNYWPEKGLLSSGTVKDILQSIFLFDFENIRFYRNLAIYFEILSVSKLQLGFHLIRKICHY